MGWLVQQVLPLLVFLLYTSPAFCSNILDDVGFARGPLKQIYDTLEAPIEDVDDYADDYLDDVEDYAEDALENVDDYADDVIDYADDIIDYAEESLGKICDNNTQIFLWSPYKRARKFLKRFANYSLKSGFFTEIEVAGLVTDMEDGIISILKEKIQSGRFSQHLESSMNFNLAGYIIDMCHGDASDEKRTVIADALMQASIDTTGNISCSVKRMMQFIDFYQGLAVGLPASGLAAVGTISEGAGIKQFLWSPYNQASNFVNLTFHYLQKSTVFKEEQASGIVTDVERRILAFLNAKTKSGKFSKMLLEGSMNFGVSASTVEICGGKVSDQQMTAIANALTRASVETVGTEPSSLRQMIEFIVFYINLFFGAPAAVAATVAAAKGTATGTVSSVSTLPACLLDGEAFNIIWRNVLKQLGIPSYFL